jgi:peptidoglycan hydrolase-like protein with peptidoglycan-binding domain
MSGGMAGADQDTVKQVQEQLKSAGFDPGPVDGKMGPQTQKALRDYQKSKGFKSTGRLDDETRSALLSGGGSSGMSGGASGSSAGSTPGGSSGTSSGGAATSPPSGSGGSGGAGGSSTTPGSSPGGSASGSGTGKSQ